MNHTHFNFVYNRYNKFSQAIELKEKELISLVGGGGKTSLLISLSRELEEMGKRILLTTTTKMWKYEAEKSAHTLNMERCSKWKEKLKKDIKRYKKVFLGKDFTPDGKIKGINKDAIDEIFNSVEIDMIIVEADGSKGRPLKAHKENEPQIPSSSTTVVGIMGADVLGKILDNSNVLRIDEFSSITGIEPGDRIGSTALIKLISHPLGLFKDAPGSSNKVLFLNRLDMVANNHHLNHFIENLLKSNTTLVNSLIIGSIKECSFGKYIWR